MKKLWLVILILGFVNFAMAYDLLCMAERQVFIKDSYIIEDAEITTYDTPGLHIYELHISKLHIPNYVAFYDKNDTLVGKLYIEAPMRFEGNAEESAKMFFEYVIKHNE